MNLRIHKPTLLYIRGPFISGLLIYLFLSGCTSQWLLCLTSKLVYTAYNLTFGIYSVLDTVTSVLPIVVMVTRMYNKIVYSKYLDMDTSSITTTVTNSITTTTTIIITTTINSTISSSDGGAGAGINSIYRRTAVHHNYQKKSCCSYYSKYYITITPKICISQWRIYGSGPSTSERVRTPTPSLVGILHI